MEEGGKTILEGNSTKLNDQITNLKSMSWTGWDRSRFFSSLHFRPWELLILSLLILLTPTTPLTQLPKPLPALQVLPSAGTAIFFFFFFFKAVSTCQRHCHPSQVLKPGTQARACACTVVSDSATPRTVTYQAPLPMNFPGKNTGVVAIFYSTLILLLLLVSV